MPVRSKQIPACLAFQVAATRQQDRPRNSCLNSLRTDWPFTSSPSHSRTFPSLPASLTPTGALLRSASRVAFHRLPYDSEPTSSCPQLCVLDQANPASRFAATHGRAEPRRASTLSSLPASHSPLLNSAISRDQPRTSHLFRPHSAAPRTAFLIAAIPTQASHRIAKQQRGFQISRSCAAPRRARCARSGKYPSDRDSGAPTPPDHAAPVSAQRVEGRRCA